LISNAPLGPSLFRAVPCPHVVQNLHPPLHCRGAPRTRARSVGLVGVHDNERGGMDRTLWKALLAGEIIADLVAAHANHLHREVGDKVARVRPGVLVARNNDMVTIALQESALVRVERIVKRMSGEIVRGSQPRLRAIGMPQRDAERMWLVDLGAIAHDPIERIAVAAPGVVIPAR